MSSSLKAALPASLLLLSLLACRDRPSSTRTNAEKAENVLRQCKEFYDEAPSFRVALRTEVQLGDQSLGPFGARIENFVFKAPDLVQASQSMPGVSLEIMEYTCDGSYVYQYWPALNRYTYELAATKLDDGIPGSSLPGIHLTLQFLRGKNGIQEIIRNKAIGLDFHGIEEIDGLPCHRISVQFDEKSRSDVWIAAEGDPLIRRMYAERDVPAELLEEFPFDFNSDGSQFVLHVQYDQWELAPELDDRTFVFRPPPEARPNPDSIAALPTRSTRLNHPLLGEEPPSLEIETLDGASIDLHAELGRVPIVLQFWNSQNLNAMSALRSLSILSEATPNEAAHFYAVNISGDESIVRAYIQDFDSGIRFAVDADGASAATFDLGPGGAIFLIGLDGSVQSVHGGYNEELADALLSDLQAIQSGKNLAAVLRAQTR